MDRLAAAIQAASDPNAVMQRVTTEALALTPGALCAAIYLFDGARLTAASAAGTVSLQLPSYLSLDGTIAGRALRTGETVYCKDTILDACLLPENRYPGIGSVVCVPLHRGDRSFGVLSIAASAASAFSGDQVRVLGRLGEFVAAAVGGYLDISFAAGRLLAGDAETSSLNQAGRGPVEVVRSPLRPLHRFLANVLEPGVARDVAGREELESVLANRAFAFRGQPIVCIRSGKVQGVEALAHFPGRPSRATDAWFSEAARLGLGARFELAAMEAALALTSSIDSAVFLSINLGPEALASPDLLDLLAASQPQRIVIELTEHLRIDDYPELRRGLTRVRDLGTRLAVDDAGAGFASLGHILNLAPEIIKLDRAFSCGIDCDPARRAIAQSLVSLATEIGAVVIAEGVETSAELTTIRDLGIPFAQGYFLSRPVALSKLPRWLPHAAASVSGPRRLNIGSGA